MISASRGTYALRSAPPLSAYFESPHERGEFEPQGAADGEADKFSAKEPRPSIHDPSRTVYCVSGLTRTPLVKWLCIGN